jgi:uncharacterized cupredoxin-like copper-binding protein
MPRCKCQAVPGDQIVKNVMAFATTTGWVTLGFMALAQASMAETVVKVSLWDKGPASMDMMDTLAPMGMAMPGADMSMATMGITVDLQVIPAGDVTFQVINDSGEFYHEMIVLRLDDPANQLPYIVDEERVDAEGVANAGKLKELKPHQSGTLKLALEPGTYILYCNIAGHYMMGMWALVTVTG